MDLVSWLQRLGRTRHGSRDAKESAPIEGARSAPHPRRIPAVPPPLPRIWRAIGKSIRGASHLRSGLPNQDAIQFDPESGAGSPVIVAVSDGHGSAKSFRSDVGASLGVQAAVAECRNLLSGHPDLTNLSAIKRTAEELLPQQIVRHWERLVNDHLLQNPVSIEEFGAVEKARGAIERQSVEANPLICYGATAMTAVVADAFIFFLQLGDGDILTISEEGTVSRPMAADERLIANETTSLCMPNAWRDFRFAFQALSGAPPALILISTDGYINSFTDPAGFLKAGSDFLELIRSAGLPAVQESLETWLSDASTVGSGDDITVSIIYSGPEKPPKDAIPPLLQRTSAELYFRGLPSKSVHQSLSPKPR
jgi:serine/threonine protein phosphatase PrpC